MKIITKVEDVRAGLYIRAIVNGEGARIFHCIQIAGRPFKDKSALGGKLWKLRTRHVYCTHPYFYTISVPRTRFSTYYAQDFGLTPSPRKMSAYYDGITVCLPFTSALWTHLKTLQSLEDRRPYYDFLVWLRTGKHLTESDWLGILDAQRENAAFMNSFFQ